MADPAVEAALEVLATTRHLSMKMKVAELIVAAVTPLIRRQAFTEAADAIESVSGSADFRFANFIHRADAISAVRGLREGTE